MDWKPESNIDNMESLCPLDVSDLQGLTTDFELYIDVAGKPVLYAQGPYQWSMGEINRLHHDGFSVLFYRKAQYYRVNQLLSNSSKGEDLIASTATEEAAKNQVTHSLKSYLDWLTGFDMDEAQIQVITEATDAVMSYIDDHQILLQRLSALNEHDYYSFYHSIRTTAYTAFIAVKLGFTSATKLQEIILGSLFHDIGHIKVSKEILEKRSRLDQKEWFEIKQHPLHGIELLKSIPLSSLAKEIILKHHERDDGHGYPYGIKGGELSQEVRIVTFCDMFDALTSPRPYQNPISFEAAIDFIAENALEFLDRKSFEIMKNLVTGKNIKLPA